MAVNAEGIGEKSMNQILVAFITGLTTGGLSCLMVQGGLLASSLARQLEQDMLAQPKKATSRKSVKDQKIAKTAFRPHTALPIALFLGAKMVAYTLLGFLLGLLGSMLTLTPVTRAVLMLAIGFFMIGNALRMFNIHPIFRYFVIQPPSFVTRYIRRKAKNGAEIVTPLFLGLLTVLIPCGVTQAMMAVAIGTGNPLQGAAILFAFTLGASPVFFTVAYLTTRLGARLETLFMRFVAVVVLILGLVSIENGLNLMGSPYSLAHIVQSASPSKQQAVEVVTTPASSTLTLNAANNGYRPQILHAKANEPITLTVVTNNTRSCSRSFVIPKLNVEKLLPVTGTVPIQIPAQKPGTELFFSCSMGMYSGKIIFQ
jgi:sulfite exporter TauE/SafE